MAWLYKRKPTYKRKTWRKRKTARKSMTSKAKAVNRSSTGLHYFKRRCMLGAWNGNSVDPHINGALSFKLNQIPNHTDFTSLFDQYRITGVKLTFYPVQDSSQVGSVFEGFMPQLIYVVDRDDNTTLAGNGSNTLMEYQSCQIRQLNRPVSVYIRNPSVAAEIYRSTTLTAYSQQSRWLDCNYSDIPHYGLKFYFYSGSPVYQVRVYATFYISCKGVQ